MRKQNFSLVELLVVIGIIVLLAGLMIPAVISSKTKGMITEAKADMTAIKMALTAVERDYKTIFRLDSNFNVTGGNIAKDADSYDSGRVRVVRYDGSSSTEIGYYDALIRELSVPREITNNSHKNFNRRNIKYLDPREDYNTSDNSTLWRDPWGNPYTILVNTNSADMVYLPYNTSNNVQNPPNNRDGNNMVLRGKVFVYSWGPNGEDNDSFNADNGGYSTTDDVRGWEK